MKKLLTVAGSDSSGGAGIQADLKTFAALGAYGMSCICTLTAQNTTGVSMVVNTPVEMVTAQLEAVYSDIPPDGVKTGMLSTPAIVSAVAEFLRGHKGPAIVVDPVMVATTGAVLLEKEAIETYKDILIPEADLITPSGSIIGTGDKNGKGDGKRGGKNDGIRLPCGSCERRAPGS